MKNVSKDAEKDNLVSGLILTRFSHDLHMIGWGRTPAQPREAEREGGG